MNKKWMTVLILGAITLVGCNQIRQSYEVSVSDEIQNEAFYRVDSSRAREL